jgi:hypothetical protein
MTVLMTFNKEQAVQAGSSMGINESGAYIGTLEAHSFTKASNAAGIEFTLNSPDGKAQFLSLYHTKKDGNPNPMGANMIQAIMGILQIKQITGVDTGKKDYSGGTVLTIPEFEDREIGLILQKELTTKGDGSDSYSFDIKMAFHHGTRKTLLELMENKPAVTVDKILSTLKDKDSRKSQGGMGQQQAVPQSAMPDDFDNWG